jgi:methionyl-tRNA synthetase
MAKGSFFITTTLPYVNADPHIGFALEIVQADAIARYRRLMGDEVFFLFGTDEHGQKIFQAAEKAGQDVQEYVDKYAEQVRSLTKLLSISNDSFIRTTDPHHTLAVQEMWRRCAASGDIYKKSYTGLYCVGCEMFKTEKELVDGRCILHPSLVPEEITEENYFFRLSKYQDYLIGYLSNKDSIVPEWRRMEALNFVQAGLEDFSISREKKRLSWGLPVPDDDSQVMYVWFDGLTGYISPLGWPEDAKGNFKKFWTEGETLQVAGKDQIRFQSIMWQAMLKSAGLAPTNQVFYHGFINSGGQRMSKSLGNVISPHDVVKKYGIDAARYLLLRHVHFAEDSDVTWERLDEWYESGLANGIGNLVARIMKLAEDHLEAPIAPPAVEVPPEFKIAFDAFEFNRVMDIIWNKIQELDQRITAEEPFKLVKGDKEKGKELIATLVADLYHITRLLHPMMPGAHETIKTAILQNKKPNNLFARLL